MCCSLLKMSSRKLLKLNAIPVSCLTAWRLNSEIFCNRKSVIKINHYKYAKASCFHAAAVHQDFNDGVSDFTDDYRGCSPFVIDRDNENNNEFCQLTNLNNVNYHTCKNTCTYDNCNTDEIQQRNICYTCSAQRGADGLPKGVGDDRRRLNWKNWIF